MFEKMQKAKLVFDAYEKYKKKDDDQDGIADVDEDVADARELYEAALQHDAGAVLEKFDAIRRRSGDDIQVLINKLVQ